MIDLVVGLTLVGVAVLFAAIAGREVWLYLESRR